MLLELGGKRLQQCKHHRLIHTCQLFPKGLGPIRHLNGKKGHTITIALPEVRALSRAALLAGCWRLF